ncbi:MAG: MFS transporter [Rhodobacteraceae bacterium]|nr:MFS transporter [Paracoccaceae bacterium]
MPQSRYAIVLGAGLTQFSVIGLFFAYGLFFKSFEVEFGWSRTLMSAVSALAVFMMGALAALTGRLADRFGPRPVLLVSGLCYGLGYALISQITAPWQMFLLFGTLLGAGLSTHDVVTLSTVARWFEKKRGIMSGVVKVGTALGQVTLPPLAAVLIVAYGWRNAAVILGVGAGIVLMTAALMMSHPRSIPASGGAVVRSSTDFAAARRSRLFWTLCAIQFLFFPAVIAIPMHIAVHGMDLGMTSARAATLLSVIGGASVAGRLAVGLLVDRIGGKRAMTLCIGILATSLALLVVAVSPIWLYAVLAGYGIAHGGMFTVVSPTVAGYFGMRAHGAIFGAVLFSGTIGGSIGPVLTGLVFDLTGSYQLAFAGMATLAAIGLGLAITLPKPGKA